MTNETSRKDASEHCYLKISLGKYCRIPIGDAIALDAFFITHHDFHLNLERNAASPYPHRCDMDRKSFRFMLQIPMLMRTFASRWEIS